MSSLFGIGGGGNVGAAGGFYGTTIDQSLRFNDGDSAHLNFTPSSAGDQKTWTWSAWIKRGTLGVKQNIFNPTRGGDATNESQMDFTANDQFQIYDSGALRGNKVTTRQFRDPSAWYHIVVALDTTDATAADRVKIYVNGERETAFSTNSNPSLNTNWGWNAAHEHSLGSYNYGADGSFFDGYMAEVHFIDGTALDPTSFGEEVNGVWRAISYSGSYGTNGFYLSFADSAAIGDDLSGNTNDWTANNLAASDVVPDSPTNNFGTMNVLDKNSMTLSEGNLRVTPTADFKAVRGTFGIPTSGKWYFEARIITGGGGNVQDNHIGVVTGQNVLTGSSPYPQAFTYGVGYIGSGQINRAGSASQTGLTAFSVGTILGVAVNLDDNEVQFYINGTAEGTTETLVSTTEPNFAFYVGATNRSSQFNFGQDSTFAGAITAGGNADANGYGDFKYAPPSGFLALCSANLDELAIGPNSTTTSDEHFNTVLYTGNGSTQSITGVGFQPDWTWIKSRGSAADHYLVDSVRGDYKQLVSNSTAAESTNLTNGTSLDADGFSVGALGDTNSNTVSYASWNWKAGGTAVSNTDGSITSSVSANQDAGFSVIGWTGNGTNNATIGHGLSQTPDMVIVKNRSNAFSWLVWHKDLSGATYRIDLQGTGAQYDDGVGALQGVSSSLITLGSGNAVNQSSANMIAYAFHDVDGHLKCGKYVGNGSADGTFIYTGFRPAWVMVKRTNNTGSWLILDSERSPFNQMSDYLTADTAAAEVGSSGSVDIDFLSNGFKLRSNPNGYNGSGDAMVYLAFAEAPFKYANAR